MRNYADEVNLHARIYALKGRLLVLHDYASIIREQQADSFKLSPGRDLIETKEILFREQIAPVIGLTEAYDKYAPLFLAYLQQFEVHNAKILLAKAAGRQSDEQWYDIGRFAILGKGLLQKKLSLSEIRSLIADTYLEDDFKNTASYRQMEIHADICAARKLYHSSTSLSSQSQKEFQEMMRRRIAVLTVIWSYRMREYYRFRDEKIRFYAQKFHELCGSQAEPQIRTVEDALSRRVEQLHKGSGREPFAVDIERYLEQDYFTWVSSMFHRDFHSLYCVIAYLWLLFYQIRNLFRIIDGRRFGFSADTILAKLICKA
jgi:vacuolar-type H+-ATPase subunit C/Vma6